MKCLLIIDVQNDFLPGGSLAVPAGHEILPVINDLMERFSLVAATQDWHPRKHVSFASSHAGRRPLEEIDLDGRSQTLWPDHCLQGTPGADFPRQLNPGPIAAIFRKGMDPAIDSYSGFFDNQRARQTGLTGYLRGLGVEEIVLVGLAAEVCVAYTAADGLDQGFRITVVEEGIRPIDPETFREKKQQLVQKGVRFSDLKSLAAHLAQAA